MKRFLLFSGLQYYPRGGWHDFIKDFDLEEEAKKYFKKNRRNNLGEWYHIVDLTTGKTIAND